ncbi:hypothetical protein, partial [Rhizobium rosettiformans]
AVYSVPGSRSLQHRDVALMFVDTRSREIKVATEMATLESRRTFATADISFSEWKGFRFGASLVVPKDHPNVASPRSAQLNVSPQMASVEIGEIVQSLVVVKPRFKQFSFGGRLSIPQPMKASFTFRGFATPLEIEVPTAVDVNFSFRQFSHGAKINIPPLDLVADFRFPQFNHSVDVKLPIAAGLAPRFAQFNFGAAVKVRRGVNAFFTFGQFTPAYEIDVPDPVIYVRNRPRFAQFRTGAAIKQVLGVAPTFQFGQFTHRAVIDPGEPQMSIGFRFRQFSSAVQIGLADIKVTPSYRFAQFTSRMNLSFIESVLRRRRSIITSR